MTPTSDSFPAIPPPPEDHAVMGIWYLGVRYEVSPRTEAALRRVLKVLAKKKSELSLRKMASF